MQSALNGLSHLILITNLRGRYYLYSPSEEKQALIVEMTELVSFHSCTVSRFWGQTCLACNLVARYKRLIQCSDRGLLILFFYIIDI